MMLKTVLVSLLLLLQSDLIFAQSNLIQLPSITSPADTDLLYVVKPGDATADRKWTIADFKAFVSALGSFTPSTSAQLAAALDDETGTLKSVFSDSPTFTTKITTPRLDLGTCIAFQGAGSPEGALTASVCSTYYRTDGGASTTVYVKESGSGNTGWVPYGNPAGSGAPTTVPFWTTVPDGGVSNEFAMSLLGTGLVRNTATTGIPTIATACTHYLDTTCVLVNANLPATITGRALDNTNTVTLLDSLFAIQDNGDPTKQMRFELSGNTTGVTRTLILPNADTYLLGASHFPGTALGSLERTGVGTPPTYIVIKHNRAATANPSNITDDSVAGYGVGSEWINITLGTVWKNSSGTAGNANWVQSGVAATPGMQAVSDVDRAITNATSFATAVKVGSATSGTADYDDPTLGPIRTTYGPGGENDVDWRRKLNPGKLDEITNSSGTPIRTLDETTGAHTNFILNAESSGNTITLPYEEWKEVAACNNVTAALIFNSPTANAPAATCEGTNTRIATADFDATTDEGFDFSWQLSSYHTGSIDWMIKWKGAATSGAVGWCVQMVRIPAGAISDPALPAQAAGNCTSTTVAGTTLQEVVSTITGATCTACVAGDRLNVRVSRDANGGAVTDSMTGDAKMIMLGKRWREAK